MANNNHIAIAGENADGILDLFFLYLGGKCAGLLGRQDASAEAQHGGFEGKTRARGGRIE
jgi:hypothetical protein